MVIFYFGKHGLFFSKFEFLKALHAITEYQKYCSKNGYSHCSDVFRLKLICFYSLGDKCKALKVYKYLVKRYNIDYMKEEIREREHLIDIEVDFVTVPALQRCFWIKCKNVEKEGQKFLVCSSCRIARYCSKKCQKKDWKKGEHKIVCSHLKYQFNTCGYGD